MEKLLLTMGSVPMTLTRELTMYRAVTSSMLIRSLGNQLRVKVSLTANPL